MPIPAIGTTMYRDTPNNSAPAAMPANCDTVVPRFARISPSMTKKVVRRPKRSRIRSVRPLPVEAPMRAAISCTITSPMVTHRMIQRKR